MAYGPKLITDPMILLGDSYWARGCASPALQYISGGGIAWNTTTTCNFYDADALPDILHDKYRIIAQVEVLQGSVRLRAGDGFGPVITQSGFYSQVITHAGTGQFGGIQAGANSIGSMSYIQIQEKIPMALTNQGFKLVVSMRDAGNDPSRVVYDLVAATHADAVTAAATILTRLGAVTDLAIEGYSIVNNFLETAFALPSTGQAEERAKVVAAIDGSPNKKATIYIPGPADSIFSAAPGNPGYNVVDVFDTDLDAYVDIWKATGALATISDGENLADQEALSGKRTHRKSSTG